MARLMMAALLLGLFYGSHAQTRTTQGSCPVNACSGDTNGACVDTGLYGYYTCQCTEGNTGDTCAEPNNDDLCPGGHVFTPNAIRESFNYPGVVPHRSSCYFLVNVHGATRTRITVDAFGFEEDKDGLDFGEGLIVDFASNTYVTYDDANPLTTGIIETAQFWFNMFTDKNINSAGYRLQFSADGDDCLATATPCQNGGTCVDGWQTYTCNCPPGYEGDFCEIDVDNCRSIPCLNGGTCTSSPIGYTCACTASYTGTNCQTGIVIVQQTSPNINNAGQVLEGSATQSIEFNLVFSPGALADYSIGGSSASDVWGVDVFFSSNAAGTLGIRGLQTLSTLSATQRSTLWDPPSSTTISSIQATSINVGAGVLCSDLQYFCARLHPGNNPSPAYELSGVNGPDSLFGCTPVTCRGVEISSSALTVTSGELGEGSNQNVVFNFNMDSVANSGSVSGSTLWQFVAFGSTSADGSAGRTQNFNVPLSSAQRSVPVVAGQQSQFTGLSVPFDLSGSINCADVPYICGTISKASSPNPDFTITGVPSDAVFTACSSVVCRGVEITQSTLAVPAGYVQEGANNNVVLSVSLTSDAAAGSALGSGLWKMTGYASTNSAGSGSRLDERSITLSSSHSATTLNAGATALFNGVSFTLDLRNGPLCSQFQYLCVEIEKGDSPSPDFELSPASSITCTQVECRGVQISSTSLSLTTGAVAEGVASNVFFNFNADSLATYGSVSGSNLWQFVAFGSTSSDGSAGRTQNFNVPLSSAQSSVSVVAGQLAQFNGLSFSLDLSGSLDCAAVPFICVTLSQSSSPSPLFTLTGTTTDVFTSCQPLTCQGVVISSASVSVSSPALEGLNNNLPLSVSFSSPAISGTASGSGLWKITAFASANNDGSGQRQDEVPLTLTTAQARTTLNSGSTASINGLIYSLNLANGPTCSQFSYICVQIEKGDNPSPDFDLTPAVTIGCTQVTCRGIEISGSSVSVTSGELREGISQTLAFDYSLASIAGSGGVSGTNLWQFEAYGSASPTGSGARTTLPSVQQTFAHGSVGVTPGQQSSFTGLRLSVDLSGATNCDDVEYICVTIDKGSSPSSDFSLTGVPNDDVFTNCQQVVCRGVEIASSAISVSSEIREGESNNLGFSVSLTSDANGGTAVGSGLWKVTTYAQSSTGTRYDQTVITLSSSQAGVTLNSGGSTTISGLTYPLDLRDGPTCSQIDMICVQVEKGDNPSPDYALSPAVTTSCTTVTCRGIDVSQSSVSISTPAVQVGQQSPITFDFSALVNPSYGSISGSNLWSFTGWLSASPSGSNPLQSSTMSLTPQQGSTAFTSGATSVFSSLTFPLDLTSGSPDCSEFSYFCVELDRNTGASVDFGLTGDLMECVPITCVDIDECGSDPCLNQGTCQDLLNGYVCTCADGFAGTNCQTNINECLSSPCFNGGTCVDGVNRYDCDCLPGYTGTRCEIDINECASQPCQNGAACTDLVNAYRCTCLAGFTGPTCSVNINECQSGPCLNGGTCNDLTNRYTCTCVPGYTGTNCEININECASSPCQNSGTCTDGVNQYTCTCIAGYVGTHCEIDFNECGSFPCQNGGTCNDMLNRYTCTCWPGFTGTHCEIDVNECASSPCQNGGICSDFINYYTCACPPGFNGINCELNINECASSPCRNGGTCDDGVNGFTCRCAPGFEGVFCEIDINECASSPCRQGNCIDRVNAYSCVCYPGYTGTNCDININECASSPCQNGGRCLDSVNGYSCDCVAGYTSTHCEIDINECASQPCRNGGSCNDLVNSFTCSCLPGYTGSYCEVNINECLSGPCLNGATCDDGINRYTCQCAPGFTGIRCEINIDECVSNPCYNGGSCVDGVNSYTCQCTSDWTGLRCETSLNACRSTPCQNGGTCVNAGVNYICECNPGFAGDNCEIDINECASLPCQNGGVCIDGPAMYTCQCPQGFSGTNCQSVGYCDMEGVWYNECNDQITISLTSTGMVLGDYKNSVELLTGMSAPTVLVGYANQNCNFPTFGYVVTRDNGKSTTSWSGQCQLCGGEEVLYTTWTNTNRVTTCSDIKQATLIGQDKWTRYQQSQAPAQSP